MKIIALRGGDNCGKTATLNLVYNSLIKAVGIPTNKTILGGNPNDFEDIVQYKSKRIAFFTMGDYSNATINAISKYNGLNVDILIIASNIKFVNPIRVITSYNHSLVIKTIATPSNPASDSTANSTDANIILSLI